VTPQILSNAASGHAADPRADRLDHAHQRKLNGMVQARP
jgi:hypothetical protein